MKRIFKGQSKLRLVLNTKCDLTDWKEAFICFEKPDKTFGEFRAAVLDESEGTIFYNFSDVDELDQSGFWRFYPKIVFDDDRVAFGRAAKVFVYEK